MGLLELAYASDKRNQDGSILPEDTIGSLQHGNTMTGELKDQVFIVFIVFRCLLCSLCSGVQVLIVSRHLHD